MGIGQSRHPFSRRKGLKFQLLVTWLLLQPSKRKKRLFKRKFEDLQQYFFLKSQRMFEIILKKKLSLRPLNLVFMVYKTSHKKGDWNQNGVTFFSREFRHNSGSFEESVRCTL